MLKITTNYNEKKLKKAQKENIDRLKSVQKGESVHAGNTGWINTTEHASKDKLDHLNSIAKNTRENADVFILIGVGGSNNAARSVIEALQPYDDRVEIIYSGNTLSAYSMEELFKKIEGKSVYINCLAKNFETLEPGAAFRVIRQYMYKQYGESAKDRIICTGTIGSYFESFSEEHGYQFLDYPENIGGRYTAISNVGLLPMAVAGIDIESVVEGARDMEHQLQEDSSIDNPAYLYAVLRNNLYKKGFRIEMLASFEPQFEFFSKWWIQLFAESEGKEDKGIYPTFGQYSEDLHSVGQFVQEGTPIIFETFINVVEPEASYQIEADDRVDHFDYLDNMNFTEINKNAYEATVEAHGERLPLIEFEIEKIDANTFGQLFYFFQYACYLSCRIMGVNPFNQTGVENYKSKMFNRLKNK